MGEIAVNAFFGISGFLISSSWIRRPEFIHFVQKRARRILPGLWFCLLVTGFVFFPAIEFFHTGTNSINTLDSLYYFVAYSFVRLNVVKLGSVYDGLPANGILNNSLWSLFPEVLCYLLIPAIFLLAKKLKMIWIWLPVVLLFAFVSFVDFLGPNSPTLEFFFPGGKSWLICRYATQASFFLSGSLLCVCAQKVICNWQSLSIVSSLFAVGFALGQYRWLAPVFLPYCVLTLSALTPCLSFVDRMGDYSYGIYIYHYPIIQALLWLGFLNNSPSLLVGGISLLATLPIAVFSWFWIERPFLRRRSTINVVSLGQ